jgi:predicted ATPase
LKHFGSFTLDTANECLWRDGHRIALPPKPFAVLRYLVEHAGRLVSHDELLDAIWPEIYVQPQVLRTYMLDLRRILGDDPRCPRFIQSLPKRGYCFVAPVSEAGQAAAEQMPAPAACTLAGREHELAALHQDLERAAGGVRQVVFLTGESGIGKTALANLFREQIEQSHAAVIGVGQCIPGFAGKQDYYPLCDALRQICSSPDSPAACALLYRSVDGRGAVTAEPGQHSAALIPGDVCAAIEQIPAGKPLVLIIEDLQFSDESTVNVLSALARRHGPAKLMILVTLAPQTGSAAHAISLLMHDLRMRRLCYEMALPRLARAAVADVVRAHLQQQVLPHGLPDYVYQHSEGNPRIALAILDHLIAERILARSGGGAAQWELRKPLDQAAATPGELGRMIELEIEHLAHRDQQILEAASLAPVAFPAWLVAAALGEHVAPVEECCDDLARRLSYVIRAGVDELPTGAQSSFYVFGHALYREVLYERQSPARRSLRHVRIATRLREIFDGREELIAHEAATHYQAAGDWPNAIAMLQVAAHRALAQRAYGDAAELHRQIACIRANLPIAEQNAIQTDGSRAELAGSHDSALALDRAPAKA